ncbi:MAG: endonuclease/exonuclease/phosphatase family protein [Rhodospirillales bacterium]|nr:endonuclease/exonuclease/phosphatase family protein [Rhodospirillales bacterium]
MTNAAFSAQQLSAEFDETPFDRFTAATYNIHRCIGTDGRYSPSRVADVLEEVQADVVGLQEVDTRLHVGRCRDQISYLAERLDFYSVSGARFAAGCGGRCANAVLSRWPIFAHRVINLTVPGREPRTAIEAQIRLPTSRADTPAGSCLRVVVTHFGLRGRERLWQLETLLTQLGNNALSGSPLLLMGDLNEWRRSGPITRGLCEALICGRSVASFPSRYPLLPLDRMCSRSLKLTAEPRRHVSRSARVASDHLPVSATFSVITKP